MITGKENKAIKTDQDNKKSTSSKEQIEEAAGKKAVIGGPAHLDIGLLCDHKLFPIAINRFTGSHYWQILWIITGGDETADDCHKSNIIVLNQHIFNKV